MISLFNLLQLELHFFPVVVVLIFLLPLSSNLKVRYYACYTVYVISFFILSLVCLPFLLLRPKNVHNLVLLGYILRHVSKLIRIKFELRGGQILEVERGAVIVANHQSMFDLLGMLNIWHVMGKCAAVAKKELLYAGPFGLAAFLGGTVFIDRRKGKEAIRHMEDASRLVTKEKTKMWIYPEGTRNQQTDSLLPFKRGAFKIAISCQAPIIPILFSPYYFRDPVRKTLDQGRVIIQVMEPISTKGLTEDDVSRVMEETRDLMIRQYEMLKQEVKAESAKQIERNTFNSKYISN